MKHKGYCQKNIIIIFVGLVVWLFGFFAWGQWLVAPEYFYRSNVYEETDNHKSDWGLHLTGAYQPNKFEINFFIEHYGVYHDLDNYGGKISWLLQQCLGEWQCGIHLQLQRYINTNSSTAEENINYGGVYVDINRKWFGKRTWKVNSAIGVYNYSSLDDRTDTRISGDGKFEQKLIPALMLTASAGGSINVSSIADYSYFRKFIGCSIYYELGHDHGVGSTMLLRSTDYTSRVGAAAAVYRRQGRVTTFNIKKEGLSFMSLSLEYYYYKTDGLTITSGLEFIRQTSVSSFLDYSDTVVTIGLTYYF